MEPKDIKIIKEKMGAYQSPIDANAAWSKFQKKTGNKKGLIIKLNTLIILLLLTSTAAAAWVYFQKLDTSNKGLQESSSNKVTAELKPNSELSGNDDNNTQPFKSKDSSYRNKTFSKLNKIELNKTQSTNATHFQKEKMPDYNTSKRKSAKEKNNTTFFTESNSIANKQNNTTANSAVNLGKQNDSSINKSILGKENGSKTIAFKEDKPIIYSNDSAIKRKLQISDTSKPTIQNDTSIRSTRIVKGQRKHSFSVSYQYGISESNNGVTYSISRPGVNSSGNWAPHAHQGIVLGYQFSPNKTLQFHTGISTGLGYITRGFESDFKISQNELAFEFLTRAYLLQKRRLAVSLGLGIQQRNFTLNYEANQGTSLTTKFGNITSGSSKKIQTKTTLFLGELNLEYHLNQMNSIQLSGLYQRGDYARPSIRLGYLHRF